MKWFWRTLLPFCVLASILWLLPSAPLSLEQSSQVKERPV
jgi:hypothetical protein